ncbi:MAG TPA: polyphenol oxidase family protein [Longimicrobiales bacterium]|nr:polyphenol oxidase family protein [Longimicrobiales bacterium]
MSRTVREERRGNVPLFVHPEWEREFPWMVQGVTGQEAGNFASFGAQTAERVHAQWKSLRGQAGMVAGVLGRQVHGAVVLEHGPLSPGMLFANDSDGQLTTSSNVLLGVTIADCVPVLLLDPDNRTVAALHAGWRGTAANILRNCVDIIGKNVRVHLGPSICGDCYEVGPEVHVALGLAEPPENTPVDLRAVLRQQCSQLGIADDAVTTSAWCTRCGDSPFFSHRAGHPERQVAVIGMK